ncbi:MAG: serine/threonine phosphatase, partial [Cyanobacteriota bacterium]
SLDLALQRNVAPDATASEPAAVELGTGKPITSKPTSEPTDEPITAELVAPERVAAEVKLGTADSSTVGATSTLSTSPDAVPNPDAAPMTDSAESETTEILFPTVSQMADVSVSASPTRLELVGSDEDSEVEGDDLPTVVLPMKLIGLEDAGRSDIGRQREHNEDYYAIQVEVKKLESQNGRSLKAKGLYILCDGMGGHASGEVASALAASTLQQYFQEHWKDGLPSESVIREGILLANKAIYTLNQENASSGSGRMGTTLVLALIQDTEAAIAHVGDSRLYRYSRRRGLEQLTIDHEVGQREIQRGVEPAIAYGRPDAYQLTQALGPRDEHFVNPDVQFVELTEDLLLLLCSDGLTDNDLLEAHVESHLEPMLNGQVSLEDGVNRLIDLANQHNGHDNITAIAIHARVRPNLDMMNRG